MKQNNKIRESINENLSTLYITPMHHAQLMESITGGTKVKKKLTLGLVMALGITLLALTAFAAIILTRSPQADAVTRARHALMEKYGLTPDTLGTFIFQDEKRGEQWTVTFKSASFHPSLTGEYTVVLEGDQAEARWSHDDKDKATWEKAGLSSPVWGQPQLAEALHNREKADPINIKLYAESPVPPMHPQPDDAASEKMKEGYSYWNGEFIKEGQPGPDDLTQEQAMDIAHQAFMADFGLNKAELEAGTVLSADFYTREKGGTLWGIGIWLMKDGTPWDCGVMMDGKTGEVLLSNIITGANE